MVTKTVDSKGRIALGKAFANSTVLIERIGPSELRVIKARVIPEQEAWLWENEKALGMVRRGLEEARRRKFAKSPPDLDRHDAISGEADD